MIGVLSNDPFMEKLKELPNLDDFVLFFNGCNFSDILHLLDKIHPFRNRGCIICGMYLNEDVVDDTTMCSECKRYNEMCLSDD
jgi:hypothetical protein